MRVSPLSGLDTRHSGGLGTTLTEFAWAECACACPFIEESLYNKLFFINIAIMPPDTEVRGHLRCPYATRLWDAYGVCAPRLSQTSAPPPLPPHSPRSLWPLAVAHQHHRHVIRTCVSLPRVPRLACCSSALARAAGRMLLAGGADRLVEQPLLLAQPPDLDGHRAPLLVDADR